MKGIRANVPPAAGARSAGEPTRAISQEALSLELCGFRGDMTRMMRGLVTLETLLGPVPELLGEIVRRIERNTECLVAALAKLEDTMEKGNELIAEGQEMRAKGDQVVSEVRQARAEVREAHGEIKRRREQVERGEGV